MKMSILPLVVGILMTFAGISIAGTTSCPNIQNCAVSVNANNVWTIDCTAKYQIDGVVLQVYPSPLVLPNADLTHTPFQGAQKGGFNNYECNYGFTTDTQVFWINMTIQPGYTATDNWGKDYCPATTDPDDNCQFTVTKNS